MTRLGALQTDHTGFVALDYYRCYPQGGVANIPFEIGGGEAQSY